MMGSARREPHTLVQPEIIHPVQLLPPRQDTPERALMRAILDDALHQCLTTAHQTNRRDRRIFAEVAEWFSDPSDHWIFSFQQICLVLEIDACEFLRALEARIGLSLLPMPSQDAVSHEMPLPRYESPVNEWSPAL